MQYQPLSDYLLISDIDGTLVNTKKEIPPRNIEAIAHFREMGRPLHHCHRAFAHLGGPHCPEGGGQLSAGDQ